MVIWTFSLGSYLFVLSVIQILLQYVLLKKEFQAETGAASDRAAGENS